MCMQISCLGNPHEVPTIPLLCTAQNQGCSMLQRMCFGDHFPFSFPNSFHSDGIMNTKNVSFDCFRPHQSQCMQRCNNAAMMS